MEQRQWQDTLTLLAMMIFADEKVYPEEVDTFKKAALELRDIVTPNLMLTNHMLSEWFKLHKDEIVESLKPWNYDASLAKLMERMNEIPNKKDIIVALMKIAIADGQRHVLEDRILVVACRAWDLDVSLAG